MKKQKQIDFCRIWTWILLYQSLKMTKKLIFITHVNKKKWGRNFGSILFSIYVIDSKFKNVIFLQAYNEFML